MLRALPAPLPRNAALIVIDIQKAIDQPSRGNRNNPDAERKKCSGVASCVAGIAATDLPCASRFDGTGIALSSGQAGNEFKPECAPVEGESVIVKRTNSAFIGTDLEVRLRVAGQNVLVVYGMITNNSIEATVRMAGNRVRDLSGRERLLYFWAEGLVLAISHSSGSARDESRESGPGVLQGRADG